MRSNHSREERQKIVEEYMQNGISPEDYLRCLFEKAPYAETQVDWEKTSAVEY